jgi:hypothetical protein
MIVSLVGGDDQKIYLIYYLLILPLFAASEARSPAAEHMEGVGIARWRASVRWLPRGELPRGERASAYRPVWQVSHHAMGLFSAQEEALGQRLGRAVSL